PVLELPVDRPRPPVRSTEGAALTFAVPESTVDGLRAVSRGCGATLFMTVLSAFGVVLGRYCAADEVAVGSAVAGRGRGEVEDLVGFFVNTLVLRLDMSRDPSFVELVGRVRKAVLAALGAQDVPFERVVEVVGGDRDRSRSPLFDVMVNFLGDDVGPVRAGDGVVPAVVKFDLSLSVGLSGGGLVGGVEFRTDLFDVDTVERLVADFVGLLEAVAADPDRRLARLPLSAPDWPQPALPMPPATGGVHELIAARAQESPDAVAVVAGRHSLTYAGLLARSRRLAGHLRGAGVGPETVVGVCLSRHTDLVVAMLAVWQAGGAYLPIDPNYPDDRSAFMLADAGARLLVTDSALAPASGHGASVVLLDDPAVASAPALDQDVPAEPEQMAYIIYTSGSTGRPKGVMVRHSSVRDLFAAADAALGAGAGGEAWSVCHSASFDFSVWEIWGALTRGVRCVLVPMETVRAPQRLAGVLAAEGVTLLSATPELFRQLAGVAADMPGLAGLRRVVFGGDALQGAHLAEWVAARGVDTPELINMYGITETTVHVTQHRVDAVDDQAGVSVGRPLPGWTVHVLDPRLNPVPVGAPGEVYVGGHGLARGYRGRPALTAERFVADPFAGDGSRLYRTGDRARWRPDGRLEFTGRVDDQLKVRGFRIEPGEIEAVLTAHPRVRAAAVTAHGHGAERRLVAYVVGEADTAALKDHAAGLLPAFMVPSIFVPLPALPLTANGKLDRAALPAPQLSGGHQAPATATEELLAGVWAELLGADRVGAGDNFFDLGGHSLLATQLISRVRTVFAVEIPLAELFDHPTVRGLAAVVDAATAGVAVPPVTPVPRDRPLPLSFAQQRLWFLDQLEPESTEYNLPLPPRRLHGPLDVAALGAALSGVVARHEVLRTLLVTGPDGIAHQVIEAPRPLPLPVVDVSGAADPDRAAQRLVAADTAAPFDLAAGPLLRATLIRTTAQEHVLAVTVHHVAFDGWSYRIFRRELDALYNGQSLPDLPIQYADYAQWQRRYLAGAALDHQLTYWRQQLAGLPTLDLPTDRPRPPLRSTAGDAVRLSVPEDVVDGLRALARDSGATMFMTLLSAFSVLLGRYCGTEDVVVGSPVANRNRVEVEGLIGFFVNTLVLRTDLSGDPAFTELLTRVKRTALDAYAHQNVPFEQLVDALVTERDRSRTPLFQVSFDYVTADPGEQGGGPADGPAGDVKFDLTVTFGESGGELVGELHYSTALFDAGTVERLARNLVEVLRSVAGDASRPLSQLPVMAPSERDRVVRAWNATDTAVPAVAGVHELVLGHAAATPDAVAVVCGARSLTYRGLVRRANGLAHRLRDAGVRQGSIVALHLDRDVDLVVAILAVWQAGGAYLPLDPDYPPDLLRFMLADSGATIVLTNQPFGTDSGAGGATVLWASDAPVRDTPPEGVTGDLAYVIYTSGTTGRPKGVQVTHDGLANLAATMRAVLGTGTATRGVMFASLSFDASVWELVMTLASGGTLAVATAADRARPDELPRLLAAHGASVAFLPPSLLRVLDPAALDGLDTLLTGAERLEPAQAAAWSARHRLLNAYGPTEATVCATMATIDASGPPPIGTPLPNTRVYVLDAHLRPVPIGAPGELYVGGAGVARGYGGRAALTAERFVADRFAGDGSRLYRTGDRARWRVDGQLEFLGRVDDQLKVRGFRIEPGEIEAALTAHPGVGSAVCAVSGERLVAYVVAADPADGVPDVDEMRAHLRQRLPEHMVPAVFTELAVLPLTVNGKVDRAALPEPDALRPAGDFLAPRTDTERVLAEVWGQVLGVENVGADDNFFDLGGDSILCIQVVARAQELGVLVTVAQMFDHQTVAALAAVATERGDTAADQGRVTGEFPLTPIQRWFFARELPEPGHFNQSMVVEATDRIDLGVLRRAVTALLGHHDALRARFARTADGWQGRIEAAAEDVGEAGPVGSDAVVWLAGPDELDAVADRAHQSLDLAAGPLVRLVVFDRGEGGQLLLMVAHHLVVDAVSWPILLEDLAAACEGGASVVLPAKSSSVIRWAERLGELARSAELRDEVAYWEGVGRGAALLPRDGDGLNTVGDARQVSVSLDEEWTRRLLRDVPGVFRTQVNDVLLAVLGVVLCSWARSGSVLVDVEGHGREDVGPDVDVSRTVAWFTSIYPVALAGGGDLGAVLRETKERLRGVPRRGLGYGILRYLTGWTPPSTADISFNYLGQSGMAPPASEARAQGAGTSLRPTGWNLGRAESDRGERAYLIEINSQVAGGRLEMVWTYGPDTHDESTVELLAERYLAVMRDLVEYCLRPDVGGYTPSDFPLSGLDQAGVDLVAAGAGGPVDDVYPLTPLQAGMLFHTRLDAGSSLYWVQHGVLLAGTLDPETLRRAWELVFARYEVLRTAVVWDGVPEPLAVVRRSVPVPWQVLDLSGLGPDEQRRALLDFFDTDYRRGPDFAAPSLARITLLDLGNDHWQLVWSYHHLLLDGWSVPIVVGEVLACYDALASGERPRLASRRPFRDFVTWLAAQDQTEAEAYWRERLGTITEPTDLGIERDTGETGQGTQQVRLRSGGAVAEFARRHRLTVNTVVQGAWAVLMSVYSGRSDVVFGVTSSGRGGQVAGMDSMVGLLMNTTPARVTVDRGAPVIEWLRGLQEEQVAARRFEHTPLPLIQACSGVPAGRQLFNALFVFENYPDQGHGQAAGGPAEDDGGLRSAVNFGTDVPHYPIQVVAGSGRDLDVRLAYDRARVDTPAIERAAEHLAALLDGIATDDGRRVGDLSLLSDVEYEQVVRGWNGTAAPVGAGLVPERVAASASTAPDAVAVVCGSRALTYSGLLARAGRLAGWLRSRGVGAESVVGLRLPRDVDMVVGVVGVWLAGAAYLPLDPEYPAERLEFMLADSGAALVVTDVDVDADQEPPPVVVDPHSLAYVIYTSGSTGRPKGVQVAHHGLANLVDELESVLTGRVLQFASFSFDASVMDVAVALATGGTLVIAAGEQRSDPVALTALARASGAEAMNVSPSLLAVLDPARLAGVERMLIGSERVSAQIADDWAPGRQMLIGYGPTEATVICCTAVAVAGGGVPPIGGPVRNARVYVLDDALRPVPVGVAGEVFVAGAGVARGYGGRAALTAERFVADVFAGDGSRMYRTGDRARWLVDGRLDFVGRVDDQVKVRGFRVEPGEVEAALAAHPGVRSAVCVVFDQRLVAYVVAADAADGVPEVGELRGFLRQRLPEFMVPDVFVELAGLPLTANGKLDRAALPAPEVVAGGEFAPASSPTEQLLVGVWSELLAASRVGVTDDFFELGGHSLLAARVVSRIRSVFDVEVPLNALFDHPTVAGLAALVDAATRSGVTTSITPVGRDRALPLSFGQQRLWFLDRLDPGSTEYSIGLPLRLAGDLDVRALTAALGALVARHEVLRTRLVADADGVAYQVIDPPGEFALPVVDVSGRPDPLEAAQRVVAADAGTPFDLAAGPLLRGMLIRLAGEHILYLAVHHVAFDEWSGGILRRELRAWYDAIRAGAPDPLPPLPVQYADFAVWQREWLSREVLDGQLAYWRRQLAGLPELDLPIDRPRPPVRSAAGARLAFRVPQSTVESLRERSREHGATMFMTLLSAFSVLLGRYCGTDDVVVGTPVANRNRAETEGLIGFFVNTLVLRMDLSGDPTFAELLGRVRRTALDAYAHQDLPFEQLVDDLVTDRDRSRNSLFDVLVNYVQADGAAPDDPGDDASGGPSQPLTVSDLAVTFNDAGDGDLTGVVEYSTALFDTATIQRMAGHLVAVLEAAVDAAGPIRRLDPLSGTERAGLLALGTGPAGTEPWQDIPALLAEQARLRPDAVAVVRGGRQLTYSALDRQADLLARHLLARGVGRDDVVGVCLAREPAMVVAMLGVLKAGAAFLPLDPDYPGERLRYMVADSAVPLVVTQSALAETLDSLPVPRLLIDGGQPLPTGADRLVLPEIEPATLAYVIYTSGSTGRPKGVMTDHRAIGLRLLDVGRLYGLTPADATLQFAAPTFDAAVDQIFSILTRGGRLILRGDTQWTPEGVVKEIRTRAATHVELTPAFWELLVAALPDEAALGPNFRLLALGGEAVSPQALAGWFARTGIPVHNTYGPTEAAITAVAWRMEEACSPVPIGTPLADTTVYVLDSGLRLAPAGVAGELYIGGATVARGYLGRPALTAERFVADPFAVDGSRMYRTGDRVRWNAEGRLEFIGRVDAQVKVRGFRIEPGEIEAALAGHPTVGAAVVTVAGEGAQARLVAYVVPADPATGLPSDGDLREHLRRSLPQFMVPSLFVGRGGHPRTHSGSGAGAPPPAPGPAAPAPDAGYEGPATPTEELLAGVWADILRLDRVGVTDSFFELGGHSLLAIQVVSRIRTVFGAEVALAELFDRPTVRGLAVAIEGAAGDTAPPVTPADRDRPLPLSFAQQRLWFLDQFGPGGAEYNLPIPVRWSGDLDIAALTAALSAMVARHEVLRTRLVAGSDGVPHQVIDPPAPFRLSVVDLSAAAEPLAAANRVVGADAVTPFDLAAGPLLRAVLLRLAPGEHVLLLTVHHVIFDEWSDRIFRQELAALYDAARAGESNPLPALAIQYADFAVWQRAWLSGDVLDGRVGTGRGRRAGAAPAELPTDRPRPAVRSTEGAVAWFTVPEQTAARLRALSAAHGATMFMTLLSAFAALLRQYCGTDDVVVGTPVANRNRAETESLIGFFVNTLVMRADLSGDPTFGELLARERQTALAGSAHQHLPCGQLADALVEGRDRSRTPLFDVFFSYDAADLSDPPAPVPAGPAGVTHGGPVAAKFDLAVRFGDAGDGLSGKLQYSTALFDAATIERLAGHLLTLLDGIAMDDGRPVGDLPLLSDVELERVVRGWNDTAAPAGAGLVPERVVASAVGTPDAVAVVCGSQALTYGALVARAGRLAGWLRSRGVGAESVVGLRLPRDVDMVVGVVGVWLAGAAYLPLDPEYPAERLEFMLADSGAALVVTDVDVDLDADQELWVPSEPDGLAYVIYTSGSTGRPKGVQVAHGGLANLVDELGPVLTGPVLQFASFSFDASVRDVAVALSSGRTLVMATAAERAEPPLLARMMRAQGVRSASLPPSLLALMDPAEVPGLGTLSTGSERVSAHVVARWAPGRRMLVTYGPTEATVICCTAAADMDAAVPPIGGPVRNVRVYVLDDALRPVPLGVAGEVFVAGAGVARGYGGRAALTAERFVADVFAGDGSRMYRTGDRARWLVDGRLDFVGRVDDQVKVRGFRVEPGEVEAALAAHPGVRAAAVVSVFDTRLVAYVVPADVGLGMPGELRGFLRERLPEFMVPDVFVELAGLPLTVNGKLDRRALPAPEVARGEFVAASSPTEQLLVGVWSELLGASRVGVTDDFFELGGHSLLAAQAISRIRSVFDVEVPLSVIFDHPTVAGLATLIDAATRSGVTTPITPVGRDRALPLSFAQQRMWFLHRLDPDSVEYNVTMPPIALGAGLDVRALTAALGALVARHEVLRTR
ncbi:non-ribosomal peptide synthase/polyketide synthase, partial [Micromonospora sp. CPCC 205371]|nr:non-ribosomal peptide synthase/polyketide synthase [Micromonospora sp. CPCC 205371]